MRIDFLVLTLLNVALAAAAARQGAWEWFTLFAALTVFDSRKVFL